MRNRPTPAHLILLLSSLVPGCIVNTLTQTVSESGDGDTDGAPSDTETESDTDPGTETESDTDPGTAGEPTCGDGVVDEGEECDDTGESAACNADCTLAVCGDGVENMTAGEECDSMGPSASCDEDCTQATCGDDTANESAGEQCDGLDLAGLTCANLGFTGGMLACDPGCSLDPSGCSNEAPAVPSLSLSFSSVKQFDFAWAPVAEADYYRLEQSARYGEPFVPVSGDVTGTALSLTVPLHLRHEASYRLLACNDGGCTSSVPLGVMGSLVEAIGYFKASNSSHGDEFGTAVALSADGGTLVVGAALEDGGAVGIDGNGANDLASGAGAVYVLVHDGMGGWSQQAYVKASNTDTGDAFGTSVALSADGSTLVVGAPGEDAASVGIDGDQGNVVTGAGAVYVFVRDGMGIWSQQAYVKASNTGAGDAFGGSVALSGDGDTLAVGATGEDGSVAGIDGDQGDDGASGSGAVYAFVRDRMGQWSQQAYVKASNPGALDGFGNSVALSGDGDVLAVGAMGEASNVVGIDGNQTNNSAAGSGAVYVFGRDGMDAWSQQAYVKASNTGASDEFGGSVALSGDGGTLAVGATGEDGSSAGASNSGAVYVFTSDGMGTWSQQAYVKASNTGGHDAFGSSVALDAFGDVLAVGAHRESGSGPGINGNHLDNLTGQAGAVFVFSRDAMGGWSQRAYVKTLNPGNDDEFGSAVALSADGATLAAAAPREGSNATGIGGDPFNNLANDSGAVYLY